ncbi:TolC family protein [Thorsellia anophelis]|nr:TolC family protein [Thorsellia anophelis]
MNHSSMRSTKMSFINGFVGKLGLTLLCALLVSCSHKPTYEKNVPLKGSSVKARMNTQNQAGTVSKAGNSTNAFAKLQINPLWVFLHNTALVSLSYSAEIKQAETTALSTKERIDVVKGQRYPQVNVSSSSPRIAVGQSNKDNSIVSTQVNVVTPIFDWGRISAQVEEQKYAFESSNIDLRLKQDEIAYNVLSYAVEIARVRSLIQVTDLYVMRMTELVDMLSQIVEADPGRASELLQAQTKQIQAFTSRDSLNARLTELEIGINRLLGENVYIPGDLAFDVAIFEMINENVLLTNHPSILQANAMYKKAVSAAEALHASRYPQLNLNVTKNTNDLEYEDKDDPWLVGLNVSWAAFEGGSASASERAAIEEARAILYQRETILRDLDNRIKAAENQRDNALFRSKEYNNLVIASREVKQSFFEQWFHLGKKQLIDVLGAESDFYNNEQTFINLQYDAFLAQLRIYSDSGMLLSWLDIQAKNITLN